MNIYRAGHWAGGLAVLVATLALAPPAVAHTPPLVTKVVIEGGATFGSTLSASAQATGDPAPAIDYTWLRCSASGAASCDVVLATGATYRVGLADIGSRLAVRARAVNPAGKDKLRSALTAVVPILPAPPPEPPPPGPTPTPTPTPDPTPEPTPEPSPDPAPEPPDDGETFGGAGTTPAPQPAGTSAPADEPRLLTPFPVVRIKGALAPRGARVSLLRVRGPAGSTVSVRCDGHGCPQRRWSPGLGRVGALERYLRAGIRITIRVARPGWIGKHVRIVIRDGRAPYRRDACLVPGRTGAAPCPAP